MTNDDHMYEVPGSRLREVTEQITRLKQEVATKSERSVISTEERRLLIVDAVEKLRDKGVADISMNAIVTTLDMTLEKLGVYVADEVFTKQADGGMPVCAVCGGRGVEFLEDDERHFFAYMAQQRFKSVAEMDPNVRDRKRARWQEVADWFVPHYDGTYGGQ